MTDTANPKEFQAKTAQDTQNDDTASHASFTRKEHGPAPDAQAVAFSADSTVLDIVAAHRPTEAAFRSRDEQAGTCLMCNALFLTVREACAQYDLDLESLMNDLRSAAHDQTE